MSFATDYQNLGRVIRSLLLLGGAVVLIAPSGCARPYGIPLNTDLVGEAPRGQVASFQAPDEGTVWVNGGRPGQPRHIVYSGLIDRDQVITVDTAARQVLLDGKPVKATITESSPGYYQIWYQPIRHDLLAP